MSFQGIDGRARWRRTPVEEALPVTCLPYDDRIEVPEGFRAEIACSPSIRSWPGWTATWPLLLGANEVEPEAGRDRAGAPAGRGRRATRCWRWVVHGRGRSVAWTSDIGPHWLPQPFCDWPGYARLWINVLAWAAGQG